MQQKAGFLTLCKCEKFLRDLVVQCLVLIIMVDTNIIEKSQAD